MIFPSDTGRVPAKICGLTHPEDALFAAALGAAAVGVVFANGPRRVTLEQATRILADVPLDVARVGVFVECDPDTVARAVDRCRLDWVQLCGEPSEEQCTEITRRTPARIIQVHRLPPRGQRSDDDLDDAPATRPGPKRETDNPIPNTESPIPNIERGSPPHALLLDTAGAAGGSGRTFDWSLAADAALPRERLIVAGGLHAGNVREAIATIRPAAVDVSSGVERESGVKDPARIAAFLVATRAAYDSIQVDT